MVVLPVLEGRVATGVIFNCATGNAILLCMAHFPQPHSRVRAPRVRVPSNEPVKFNLGNGEFSARLHRLSLTGGLVQFERAVGELSLAEVVLTTQLGPVKALVQFLKPQAEPPARVGVTRAGVGIDGNFPPRPFRFVALDDPDFHRLAGTIQEMRRRGLGEERKAG